MSWWWSTAVVVVVVVVYLATKAAKAASRPIPIVAPKDNPQHPDHPSRPSHQQVYSKSKGKPADATYARRVRLLSRHGARAAESRIPRPAAAPTDRITQYALPRLDKPDDVVRLLGLRDFRELVLLADPSRWQRGHAPRALRNYRVRTIPKANGKRRLLYIPKPRLKAAQRRILREILNRVPPHPAATAFHPGADIRNHAARHTGRTMVLAMDLENFFPRIGYPLVYATYRWLGYPPGVARILALLCTTKDYAEDEFGSGLPPTFRSRFLPQGAPTSPALANLVARRMDARLTGLSARFGATYSRYADDLAFSGGPRFASSLRKFIPTAEKIIRNCGFKPNAAKRRFLRAGRQQKLVGLVVNSHVAIDREERDRLKAILHNARKAGSLESQNREKRADFAAHLRGRIAWLGRFHPEQAARLMAQLEALAPPTPAKKAAPPPDVPEAPPPD